MERKKVSPWSWIPSLYFAEGLPYAIVMSLSLILYKKLGLSNTEITFYTGWLSLPWVIKPLWSPFVDIIKTKRIWILSMQLFLGAAFAGIAFFIPTTFFLQATLAVFFLIAFSSATHDIAADGFYMLALDEHEQSFFVGIRTTFYRLSTIFGQGFLVYLAGRLGNSNWVRGIAPENATPYVWSLIFYFLAALFIGLFIYHRYILPKPDSDENRGKSKNTAQILNEFLATFLTFFQKQGIVVIILFLLFYRFSEAQLLKIVPLFLLDERSVGGLGLSTEEVGIANGIYGIVALTLGGILGGICISKKGLKYWLWWMVLSLNLPSLAYVYLSLVQPENLMLVNCAIFIEQFGYGFGSTAYVMYVVYVSKGIYKTAHYAICTAFMAFGMMIPGMFAGAVQKLMGYPNFFLWIMVATIPCFVVSAFVKIDPMFGKKNKLKI